MLAIIIDEADTCTIKIVADYPFFTNVGGGSEKNVSKLKIIVFHLWRCSDVVMCIIIFKIIIFMHVIFQTLDEMTQHIMNADQIYK